MQTQVVIIGGGPAGLLLSQILRLRGVAMRNLAEQYIGLPL